MLGCGDLELLRLVANWTTGREPLMGSRPTVDEVAPLVSICGITRHRPQSQF